MTMGQLPFFAVSEKGRRMVGKFIKPENPDTMVRVICS